MASSFEQTMRSLERRERRLPYVVVALAALCVWTCWLVYARVDVYASTDSARLEGLRMPNRVSAQEAGRIVAVYSELGRTVHAGDVLMELDPTLPRAQLALELSTLSAIELRVQALSMLIEAEQDVRTSRLRMDELATRRAGMELKQAQVAAEHQRTLTQVARELDARRLSARMDVVNAEAGLSEQQLLVGRAAIEVERLDATHDFGGKSQSARIVELQRQWADLKAEQQARMASVELVRAQLERMQIRAPVSGRLGAIAALQVGDVVKVGDMVATVVPQQRVHMVSEFAPSAAVGRVLPGQHARVRLNGFAWVEFGFLDATVSRVANEPHNGTIRVELELAASHVPEIPVQHGLPGSVDVHIEKASPLSLVLRSIGAKLTPAPPPPPPLVAASTVP